jgi:hypothetical protein
VSRSWRVLVVEKDEAFGRSIAKTITAVAGPPESRTAIEPLPDDGAFDLIVVGYDALTIAERAALLAKFGGDRPSSSTRLLLYSSQTRSADLAELFERRAVTNLVARNGGVIEPADLIVTSKKILEADLFGVEKYFLWGIEPLSLEISRSVDKAAVLAKAEAYATAHGVNARLVGMFVNVADELVTNAIYNAPVDAAGTRRFAHVARTVPVELEASEAVRVTFCCDGRRLGISALDPFGSLTSETMFSYLAKCLKKGDDQVDVKQGGAGLGFYQMLESVSHLVVNLDPGRRTEMIGILDVTRGMRELASQCKSFNIFTVPREGS